MHMTQLLAIILAVMTWTVESKNSVVGSGEKPTGVDASYECNYQKGTVRTGDEAVLRLTGMQHVTVTQIDVWVKSNKSAGAGVFTVHADGEVQATKSGTFASWVGKYDNSTYHDVPVWSGNKNGYGEWVISLKGTENSLYIDRYEITYQPAPCYTVRLMRGNTIIDEITETKGGAGVLLPMLNDTLGWTFVGWSAHDFWEERTAPDVEYGKTYFYPTEDKMTLWAVYRFVQEDKGAVTDLEDGDYLYVNTNNSIALAGTPDEGEMTFAAADAHDENLYYTMVFSTHRDTAYVTHKLTDTPIGYNQQAKMAAVRSPWLVYHEGEQTVLYTIIGGKPYVLWLNIFDKTQTYLYAGLAKTGDVTTATMMQLLYPSDTEEPVYSCHPDWSEGLNESTSEGMNALGSERVVQIGIYELHIKNGKKYLNIR